MQFTAVLLAALSATSFASVLPRDDNMGAWNVTIKYAAYANGVKLTNVVAQFNSESYPLNIVSTCKKEVNAAKDPITSESCDNDSFSYEWDGKSKSTFTAFLECEGVLANVCVAVKVQQNIDLPTKQTVFGSAPLNAVVSGPDGRTFKGNAIVQVTSATA